MNSMPYTPYKVRDGKANRLWLEVHFNDSLTTLAGYEGKGL